MQAQQRAERLRRDATFRLRSKFHAQSVRPNRQAESVSSYSPLAKAAMISELVDKHKEKPIDAVKQQAIAQIRSFRIPTIEEDPMFTASRRVLRAIQYFGLASEQTCADLIEMHCLHTFALDGQAMGSLFSILVRLPSLRLGDTVSRLAPRIEMVADDMTVWECNQVLNVIAKCPEKSRPESTIKAICANIKKYSAEETNPISICSSVFAVSRCDQLQGRVLLEMFSETLKNALLESGEDDNKLLHEVTLAVTMAAGGPRRLLNCICRTAVHRALKLSPQVTADVMHCMHVTSHRGEVVLRRLASIQLTQQEKQTPETVALSLAALAHFYIFDEELYSGLIRSVASKINGEQAASVLHSCGRVRQYPSWVCDEILPNFVRHVKQQSTRALCAVLLFIAEGKLADRFVNEAKQLVVELSRRKDASGREDVLRCVLALRQHAKTPTLLEQVTVLAQNA